MERFKVGQRVTVNLSEDKVKKLGLSGSPAGQLEVKSEYTNGRKGIFLQPFGSPNQIGIPEKYYDDIKIVS